MAAIELYSICIMMGKERRECEGGKRDSKIHKASNYCWHDAGKSYCSREKWMVQPLQLKYQAIYTTYHNNFLLNPWP